MAQPDVGQGPWAGGQLFLRLSVFPAERTQFRWLHCGGESRGSGSVGGAFQDCFQIPSKRAWR